MDLDPQDRVLADGELTADDMAALAWAVSTGDARAAAIVARVAGGGHRVTAGERDAALDAWKRVGRPATDRHVHRTPVTFVDGTVVTGVSFDVADPYARDVQPDFGLYLDEAWQPPWPHAHVQWPDFAVPAEPDAARRALRELVERARSGETVELGCLGGHGRTGTALACVALLTGTPSDEAVMFVRARYCDRAVETDAQEAFVGAFE